MKKKLPLLACLLIILSACSTTKKTSHSAVDTRINNIVWAVTSFRGKAINDSDFPNGGPLITFNMQDSRINGNDGCNTFMGLATYKDNSITVGALASTKMACPYNNIANSFYDILASKHLTWRLDSNETLRLYVNDAEVMALKEKQ